MTGDASTAALPKAELHCHIEGAIPPSLARRQAEKYGVDVSAFIAGDRYIWHDFTSFLFAYDSAAGLFRTAEDYAALSQAYLGSLAEAGAIYSEIFVSPDHAAIAGLDPHVYLDGLGSGIEAAREETGIEGRMIVVGIRHLGPEAVEAAARFAAGRPHPLVTGFGMAGEERQGRLSDFARAFAIARDAGLGITVHAGELAGPKSVRDALDHVRPSRIGHGIRAAEDPALVERLAGLGTVLEVCPGSNVALKIFDGFENHPWPLLQKAGVRLTLNSDDPPFFATSLEAEYETAARVFGLDDAALKGVTRTALEAAFVDEETRVRLLARL